MITKIQGTTIICDLDDVLGKFGEYIAEKLSARSGVYKTIEDYLTYEFNKYHNIDYTDFLSEIVESETFKNLVPTDGAIRALEIFVELGYTVRIVTARGAFEGAHEATTEWLNKLTTNYHSLDVVNPKTQNKSDIYSKYAHEGIATIIDDASHNLHDAIESGIVDRPVCITRPWNAKDNRFVHGYNRFDNIYDFAMHLKDTNASNDEFNIAQAS